MDSLDCLNKSSIKLLQNNNLLIPLIKSELQRQELNTIKIEKDLKLKAIQNFLQKIGLRDQESFSEWKIKNNLTDPDVENLALNEIKIKKYLKINFEKKSEARFLERKSELDIVVYSLIRVKDSDLARELYLRIAEDEAEFGDIAFEYSEGMEQKTRGIIGPAPLGSAHPKLIEHLRNKSTGEILPPILIEDSYIIARLESYDSAQLDSFMREKMSEELFNNWLQTKALEISQKLINSLSLNTQPVKI